MRIDEIEYLDGTFVVHEKLPQSLQELFAILQPAFGTILELETFVVDMVVKNIYYRNRYPRIYKKVSEGIAAEFPKLEKESDLDHLRAVLNGRKDGTAGLPEGKAKLTELFLAVSATQPLFELSSRSSDSGGKLSQTALDSANAFLASGGEEGVVAAIEATVPGYKILRDIEGKVSTESLARGIQTLNRHLERTTKEKTAAMLKQVAVAKAA